MMQGEAMPAVDPVSFLVGVAIVTVAVLAPPIVDALARRRP